METGEAIDPIRVKLPLSLRIDDGVITDIGIKDVARDLRTCIEHLKNCLKQVFSFIAVVDVKFKNGTVYFKFDVRDEQQLEAMYECLGKEKNAFSEWLSGFFITRSMELVAGLGLHTKIYCNISMPETVYLRCRLQFCEKEEQKRNINDIESQKPDETKTTVVTVRKTVEQIEKSSSLFTELISTDNMASSGTMSDNCTEQRSPGAYPYDSKESPSSTNSELVRKTLLLYYPCIKGWKVKKIEIQSESKFLNCVMDMHGIDMYECSVFLPKEPLHFSYQYVCHLKGDRIFSWTGIPPLKSRKYHLNEYTFQRDSWMSQGQHIHDQNKYDEECLTAHLRDILFHCEAIDIKHACSQIEQLCFRQLLNKNAIHLLKELETVLVKGTGKAKLLFMVVIGNVLTNIQQISQGEILNKSTINILLDNLKLFRLKDLHVSCGKYIYNVCNSLCVNVYGQEMCPVEYLSACYPFYDDSFILQRLRHHIQSGTKVAHDSKSIYDSALSLCCKLYCSSTEDSSEKAQKALDILLRHCPLNMTLYVTSKIIQNKDGMSENEVDIQNSLCIAFQVRMDSELRLIKKEKNIQKLHDLWRNTTMFIKADTQLQTKFEETLLTTLGVLPSSADCPADVVVMFIIESGFFNDKNGKKKLLQIIMDSNNNTVRELFFILSQRQELAEIFNCIDRGEFQDFALKYLTRNSSYFMDKDKELNCFLKRFCRFLNIKYLLQTCNLIEVLENILLREFDKYQPTELLKHTFVIDKMSKEYKDIDNIFVGHFNKTLKKTSERPEILLDILSIRKGKSIVETSLTARLVCILLDTHALISEESTDFDRFLCLVEQYQFWILIFKCTGQYSDMIQMNVNYKAARACISSIGHHFKTHDVHFKFLQKLERNLQSASSAKKLLQLEFDIIDIERYWSEALQRFKEVKDKLGITCEVMTQVKQKCPTLPDGFDIVLTRVSDNEKRFINGMITASECENDKRMWQDIEQLPNICEYLCKVVSSSVFWNVSSDHVYKRYLDEMERFYEDDPISSVSELFQEGSVCDRTYSSNEKGCLSFMKILQNVGPTEYEVIWKSLTRDDNFQMVDVMRMFGSKPDISREVEIAKSYLHIVVEKEVEVCLNRIFSSDSVERTVDAIESVVHVFGLDWKRDAVFTKSMTSFHNLALGKADEYTFGDVHVALKTIFSLVANISDDTVNIMTVLGRSTSLIKFISNILDEDIKNLIDAVEDISEQQVQVSTVSALIEVKQFLYPLLRSKDVKSIYELFQLLEKQTNVSKTNSSSLPQKMEDCKQNLHNLKSLYNGVANRGEQTKEMIKNIIQKGTIFFQLNTLKTCTTFQASYKQNKIKELRKQSTLIDLRSRALLLMNTERKTANENRYNRDELMKFVEEIDLCIDIAETLFTLYTSGHTDFMTVKEVVKPYDLLKRKIELNLSLNSWLHDINEERKTHYLMNFIKGNQIHILFTYLEENSKNIPLVQTIVHFIHPNMQAEKFKEIYETEKGLFLKNSIIGNWTKQKMLHCIGFSLHKSFEGLQMFQRNIQNNTSKTMNDIVLPGRLLVAQLDECSLLTVRTILALYMNTTQRLPEPNHILFCTFETSWAELELIIRRCLGSMQFYKVNVLFCIANVENLSNELQFKLVEDLRNLPKETQFCLAIICRGSRNHPFIDELSDYTSSVTPVTDKTVRDIFNEHCGNVVTITSKYSGLGKTSFIASEAHRQKRGFVTLHVSGTIRKMHLVDRIDNLHLKKHHVLHIDLGNVDSPSDLDTFLFELVVLRYVSAGTLSVGLQTSVVYIEIANTINETLRNALQTTVLFRRKEIEWSGIDDLTVSRELNSPVQVVCHYLNCLENGSIDSKDISFNEKSEKPLKSKHCKFLLHKYIGGKLETSYPTVLTFINVLSDQLKKMSQSSFFKSKRLIDMIGNKVKLSVKSQLLAAMIDVSYDFATRSIDVCRESQISAIQTEENIKSDLASSVTNRVNSMIRWEDSNHLMFLFHNQNIHTISALYRNLTLVPKEIRSLFESQMKKDMEDFKCMDQEKLQTMLQRVARVNPLPLPKKELLELSKDYALTADNLLKMVLITLRIKANIPVVVMGETGCGKTSLIRYLAAICEVDFDVMNIHAGVKEEDIIYKVMGNNTKALEQLDKEMWLFLDEINTSDCLGIMSDIICHHKCLGKELSPNLTIMGACNPYKLRTT
ncbi:uncharacterized protein LOC132715276 [Ruditapes philippinarum]|uniref:uncharacterized protein LOC132715276 n=1 Tax=Ruditapes philippinarum TaxID=129788 RepID=UPI00295B35A2|nr:uncharacterized protein LOC132715276 [Ruditapes philippinarum]